MSINVRIIFEKFVATLMLKGGLKQEFFRFVSLFFSLFLSVHVLSNWRFVLFPFFVGVLCKVGGGGGGGGMLH